MSSAVKVSLILAFLIIAASSNAQPKLGDGAKPESPPQTTGLITKIQPEQLKELFTAAGFESEVQKQDDGTVMVLTELAPGHVAIVSPISCTQNKDCGGYVFLLVLSKSERKAWIDAWNDENQFQPAALLVDGKLAFIMAVRVLSGVTPDYVKQSATWFRDVVNDSAFFKPQMPKPRKTPRRR
jgi:hypothetical protein